MLVVTAPGPCTVSIMADTRVKKRIALFGVLLVSIVLAGASGLLLRKSGESRDGNALEAPRAGGGERLLLACVENSGMNPTSDKEVIDCTARAMGLIKEQSGLLGLDVTMQAANEIDPRVLMVCHVTAHDYSKQGWFELAGKNQDLAEQTMGELFELPANGCHGGVVHGMLEGWSDDNPDQEKFARLAALCERAPQGSTPGDQKFNEKIGRCADSLGHAVQNVWGKPEICAIFTDREARVTCSMGMIMQLYQPAGSPAPKLEDHIDELLLLCREWPVDKVELRGCNAGVAFAFQRPLSDRLSQLTEGRQENQPLTDAEIESTYDALERAIGLCRRLDNDPERWCERGIVVNEALFTMPREIVRSYCLMLDPQAQGACLNFHRLNTE